jgi:hypothetical protein
MEKFDLDNMDVGLMINNASVITYSIWCRSLMPTASKMFI